MIKNLYHSVIAIIVQFLCWLILDSFVCGAFCASAIFIGREHAQAEYRWIEKYGQWRRYNLRWHNVFDRRIWDVHSFWWNLSFPIIVVATVAVVAELIKGA